MTEIPDIYLDLLLQKKAFAHLATVMADGSPQNTPVWFDYFDGKIRVNSARGRVTVRNMKPGAKVALSIMDPDNSDRYVQLRGRRSPFRRLSYLRRSFGLGIFRFWHDREDGVTLRDGRPPAQRKALAQ
jgi:hypothetical protein